MGDREGAATSSIQSSEASSSPPLGLQRRGTADSDPTSDEDPSRNHPAVKAVLDVFGGKIQNIQSATEENPPR